MNANTKSAMDRVYSLEVARVTEAAAVAASYLKGHGDEKAADQAAVDAMRRGLNKLGISGRIVIGEGERDEAPMLYIGEEVGSGGDEIDIALDPLEGTTLCAKDMPNSIAVLAIAPRGGLLNAPDVYMEKIAVGPGLPPGIISLDAKPSENIKEIAKARGVPTAEITACVLDRPRHGDIIEDIRSIGAGIRLIMDGDVAGIIHTTDPEDTGIDMYIGVGGAPEGVLAAAALRCIGGQMQGRLIIKNDEQRERAKRMGVTDPTKTYTMEEMADEDVIFAATGVTDGNLLKGVKIRHGQVTTETVVMRSWTKTVRWIRGVHSDPSKFARPSQ